MRYCLFLIWFISFSSAFASAYKPCLEDQERLRARQAELKEIARLDQWDRRNDPNIPPEDWPDIHKRDLDRRKRVGEIFGEGCFQSATDFAAAALVFQHGDAPEHYWQAFVFSMHAIRLGDSGQKSMAANGIDRYLVDPNIGHKQLFASQAQRSYGSECWCLRQVEHDFPDSLRQEYKGKTLAEALEWVAELNVESGHPKCIPQECTENLKPTPRGTVPGLW